MADAPAQQSMLMWIFGSLGARYSLLIPLVCFVSFVLTLLVVIRGRGAWAGVSLIFIVMGPFFVGILSAIDGLIMMFQVFSHGASESQLSEWAVGYSASLVGPLVSLVLSIPAYITATLGSIIRSFLDSSASAQK